MAYVVEGIIAGVVVFFALLGILILFVDDIDMKVSIGTIFLLIALAILFLFLSGAMFIAACIAIGIIAALIGNHVVEGLSMV
jgi:hypothetical protein